MARKSARKAGKSASYKFGSKRKPASRARKSKASRHRRSTSRRWSGRVTRESDALDLEQGVFTLRSPSEIAASLKRSAQASKRRKADPFRSAMSMLVFYINRAGKNLSDEDRARLEKAKGELRKAFGKEPAS
jgi:hypothetical protein